MVNRKRWERNRSWPASKYGHSSFPEHLYFVCRLLKLFFFTLLLFWQTTSLGNTNMFPRNLMKVALDFLLFCKRVCPENILRNVVKKELVHSIVIWMEQLTFFHRNVVSFEVIAFRWEWLTCWQANQNKSCYNDIPFRNAVTDYKTVLRSVDVVFCVRNIWHSCVFACAVLLQACEKMIIDLTVSGNQRRAFPK